MAALAERLGNLTRILLCVIAPPVMAQATEQQEPPPALVKVSQAQRIEMAPTTLMPGAVVSRDDARIAAEVAGLLIDVAEVGTEVSELDALARIDDTELSLSKAEAEAVLIREKAALSFAEQELTRFQGLVDKGLVSSSQLDQARSTRDSARAQRRAAEAKLNLLEDRITRTVITAPFDGVVTRRYRRPGERVEEGVEVVRLVSPDALEIQVRVSANNLPYIPLGTPISVQNGSTRITSRVRSVVPIGDDVSRLYDVRLDVADSTWPVGATVRVAIPTDRVRQVTAIPRDALVLRTNGISVFKINDENKAYRVMVETGIAVEGMIEVIGDIEEGDQVVVRGNERLREDSPVQILSE